MERGLRLLQICDLATIGEDDKGTWVTFIYWFKIRSQLLGCRASLIKFLASQPKFMYDVSPNNQSLVEQNSFLASNIKWALE